MIDLGHVQELDLRSCLHINTSDFQQLLLAPFWLNRLKSLLVKAGRFQCPLNKNDEVDTERFEYQTISQTLISLTEEFERLHLNNASIELILDYHPMVLPRRVVNAVRNGNGVQISQPQCAKTGTRCEFLVCCTCCELWVCPTRATTCIECNKWILCNTCAFEICSDTCTMCAHAIDEEGSDSYDSD
jgi:hypothetical protein